MMKFEKYKKYLKERVFSLLEIAPGEYQGLFTTEEGNFFVVKYNEEDGVSILLDGESFSVKDLPYPTGGDPFFLDKYGENLFRVRLVSNRKGILVCTDDLTIRNDR